MAAKRKFKIRVRGKVRNRLLRRGGAAAGVTLGLLAAGWLFSAALPGLRRFADARLQFRPESFAVSCPSEAAAASLRELAQDAVNKPFSARRAGSLAGEIKKLHPGLASVKVSRNFFTRTVSVDAEPEDVVSAVLADGATAYLGVSGRFMPEKLAGPSRDPFSVELRHAPRSAPELAVFLSELRPLAGLFYARPVSLACDGRSWDCSLGFEDGSAALWGGFEFTRLKILRLNEVMQDALAKSGGPLRADLRSFREGKIFVSALKR